MNQIISCDTGAIPWSEWWDLWEDKPEVASATEELTKTVKYKIVNRDDQNGDTLYLLHNAVPWPTNIGFPPLFVAYHEFTEEAFFLKGDCQILTDYGVSYFYKTGSYIWRPPGWVHDGHHHERWTILLYTYGSEYLGKEGWNTGEGFVDLSLTGQNVLHQDDFETANSPRGYIKALHSGDQRWEPADVYLKNQGWDFGPGNTEKLWFKTLSKDRYTGATTYLMKIDPGPDGAPLRQPGARYSSVAEEAYVIDGTLSIEGEGLYEENHYFSRHAGFVHGEVFSDTGALVFCKADGPINRTEVSADRVGQTVSVERS